MSTRVHGKRKGDARTATLVKRCEAALRYKHARQPIAKLHHLLTALDDRASPGYSVGHIYPSLATWVQDGITYRLETPVTLPSVDLAAECLLWQIEELEP